jgi:nicotinate-nucleotide adenylyltransferase
MTRVGILGGTFNPVHNGHLAIARRALKRHRLDRIIFIPVALPPHKSSVDLAPDISRLAMLRLALRGERRFSLSRMEIDRGGKSYTVRTVRELRRRRPGAEFHLIIGADNLKEIASWKRIGELCRRAHFIVVTRPGYSLRGLKGENAAWAKRIVDPGGSNILPLAIRVSSSGVRARARRGLSLKGLVSAPVARYIKGKGIYRLNRAISMV